MGNFNYFLHYSNSSTKFKVFDFSIHEILIVGYIIWIVLLQDKRIQFQLVLYYFQFQGVDDKTTPEGASPEELTTFHGFSQYIIT